MSLTTLGTPYTQDFNGLPASGSATWTNNSTIPGWFHARTGTGTTIVANDGSSNAGNLYSYGTGTATDRALGSVGSGNAAVGNLFWGVRLQNNTGSTINQLDVTYVGEQWRNSAAAAQTIAFSYLVGSPTVTGSLAEFQSAGVAVGALDFTSPITGGTAGALNGNLVANQTTKTFSITGLSIPNGTEVMLRWSDPDHVGADHGLSIDSFAVTPQGVAPLPQLTVTDVTPQNEGTGGPPTIFTFQVNLSAPAGPGGVTFDIATADGTAQDDNPAAEDNDYVPQALTPPASSIAAGNSSFAFNVSVNPDIIPESDETFFVNVTNVTGATVSDGQGQATILNDDVACASLSINDVAQVETDGGTTTFAFTVSLSQAGCGPVTFDIATQDNTATDADNDYDAQSIVGSASVTFPATYTFNVTVNGDVTQEPDQTFFVNVTNVSPGNVQVADGQGLGTIINDDYTRIHDIQGNGGSSPLVSTSVTTRGVVTGVKTNGYYIQEPDASVDADPATSEGIFVFTSSAPPAAATVGNYVEVTGTVAEFVPGADPLQPPLTELTSPTTTQLSTGNPLPAAIPLTATFPDPAGPHDQLERLEGMRVSVASLTVGGGTLGNKSEPNATSTSSGVFFGTVTGVPRPYREAGIQNPDPVPSGSGVTIPPVPRWDFNPETIRVDSDGLVGAPAIDVSATAVVTGLVGPLDYTFRRYTILPDPGATIGVAGGMTPTSAPPPAASEFTAAAYNMERFYDDVDDPGGDVALTTTAYNNRLNKASLGIRNHLAMPDILGVVEVENLTTLQALATKINNDAVAAAQPNPNYVAYLVEGNDVGGIDVGFLVKTAFVFGSTPRVTVNAVVQELDGTLFVNADSSTETLNDRPPLRLDAVINHPSGATYPVTVIVVHQRSLNSVNSEAAGSNGWATAGARVRAKRQKQAEDLANLIQTRQTNDPNEHIIVLGDFNAFEFNDGLGDSMNVVTGTPPPDNETAVGADGVDLVTPDLDNLFDTPPAGQRYGYVFDGQAQNIDHVLVNQALINSTSARRIEHPRINADFEEVSRGNASSAVRLSDHDPVVGYFEVPAFASADLSITKTDSADPVNAGQNYSYTITVDNAGPSGADTVSWTDTLPVGTTFVSMPDNGWTCTTPAVGGIGTVTCSIASLGVTSVAFTLTVAADPGFANGSIVSNTATVSSTTTDPDSGDLSDTETTTVNTAADLQLSKTDIDPVTAGNNLTYQITVTNNGPSNADAASWTDTLPAGTTFVSLATAGTWSCTTPAVGATGTVTCNNTTFGITSDVFTLVVNVDANVAHGTVLSNTATVSSSTTDPSSGDESDTETTEVNASADLQLSKTDSPDPVTAGNNLTYQITVTNNGPSNAAGASWTDTLPAGTTFVSLSTTGSWSCTTPAVGANGTVTCNNTSFGVTVDFFTLVVNVDPSVADGTVLSNTATVSSSTSDPNGSNDSETVTTSVTVSADLQLSKTDSPDPVDPSANLTYQITITNNGPSNAAGASWTDTLPAGTTFVSLSSTGSWSCSTPAVGTSGTVTCNNTSFGVTVDFFTLVVNVGASVAPGTILSNTATVSSSTSDPNSGNESETVTTTVGAGSADVGIVKTDTPDPVVAGSALTYTVTVTNAGPSDAANVTFTDTVPAGTTFLVIQSTIPAGWNCNTPGVGGTGTISCSTPVFPVGGNVVFSILLAVNNGLANGTVITNTATVTTTTPDSNGSNDSSTTTTTVQPLSATGFTHTKTMTGDFRAGGTITITATLTNNMGHDQGNNFGNEWAEILPPELTLVSASAPSGTINQSIPGGFVTWNGSIPNGTSITITVICTIDPGVSGTVSNQAFSSIDTDNNGTNETSSPSDDPSTAAEHDPTTITVGPSGTVTGTKSVSGTFVQGTNVTYTIVLTNNMLVTQPNNFQHEFTDIIPAGLTYVSSTASSGTAGIVVAPDTFAWNGSIPPGGTVTITITCTISPTAGGTISNQGNVIYDNDGGNSNESSTLTDDPSTAAPNDPTSFDVVQSNEVLATKSVSGTFAPGSNVTYTIVMTNNMSVAQPNNFQHEFTDILPSSLTYVSSSATSGTTGFCCSNTFFWDGSIPAGGTVTITIVATISPTATGVISNQGQTIFDTDNDNSNDSSHLTDDPSTAAVDDPTSFTVISADVSLVKTLTTAGPYNAGQSITYTLDVANAGPSAATAIQVTDTPSNLTITSVSGGGCAALPCTIASLASGANATITVTATIASAGAFDNSANATAAEHDPTVANNTDNTGNGGTAGSSADVSLVKTLTTAGPYNAGQSITYTLDVANAGPSTATTIQVTDTPANLTITSVSGGGCAALPCTIASLASGANATITVTATIAGAGAFDNSATAMAVETDPNLADNTDNAGNGGTAGTDADGDGVSDTVEQAAPNGGDGNGDGIPDYQQSTVASIPAATGSGYLTLQSSCTLTDVAVFTSGAMPSNDHGHNYPHGLIAFRAPCSTATFSLFVYGSGAVSSYRKFGPLPPGGPQQWYGIPATFSVTTVGSLHPRRIDFTLTDGQTGDDTPVDGVIVDQGGPAGPNDIPTASEWGLIALALALAAFAALKLRT